jgi:uncharacterized protein DUF6457
MNPWFEALGERFAKAAARRNGEIDPPRLEAAVAEELLELARVTARSQERRFAPLACFMAGIAVERLNRSGHAPASGDIAAYLREIRSELETELPSSSA